MFKLPRSLGLPIAPSAETQSLQGGQAVYTTQPPGWLPTPGCGIATHPTRATDATGLSPARLQPCRLLRHPSLQKELKIGDTLCLRRPAPSCVRHGSVRLSATHSAMAPTMTRRRVGMPSVLSPPAIEPQTPTKQPALRLRGGRRTSLRCRFASCAPSARIDISLHNFTSNISKMF